MVHLNARWNEYADAVGLSLFDEVPKAVLAAIAASALTGGGDYIERAAERVAEEWDILHANGIVPQKPGKVAKRLIAEAKTRAPNTEEV